MHVPESELCQFGLHADLEQVWFDLNYGGIVVSEEQFMHWTYDKIDRMYQRMITQKEVEEREMKSIRTQIPNRSYGNIRRR